MTLRNTILCGDVVEKLREMPDNSVQCVVTSPPYWSMRDYGADGQLGIEPTLGEYVCNQVRVFEEVRRVLRHDGTLWLNLGDGYAGSWGAQGREGSMAARSVVSARQIAAHPHRTSHTGSIRDRGLKAKDLMGIPWRVALALQDAGWWLRSDIIWAKPNPMPESMQDRPTRAHEYVFLLTKQPRYFYDMDAIREKVSAVSLARISQRSFSRQTGGPKDYAHTGQGIHSQRRALENFRESALSGQGRNKRSVWSIPLEASKEEHYAAFPRKLVEPCIFSGTSVYGACAECGAPFARVVETIDDAGRLGKSYHDHTDDLGRGQRGIPPVEGGPVRRTTGWRATCKHHQPAAGVSPCVVLDPYMGSGTTAIVAKKYGRDYVGIDISPEYVAMAERRIAHQQRGML